MSNKIKLLLNTNSEHILKLHVDENKPPTTEKYRIYYTKGTPKIRVYKEKNAFLEFFRSFFLHIGGYHTHHNFGVQQAATKLSDMVLKILNEDSGDIELKAAAVKVVKAMKESLFPALKNAHASKTKPLEAMHRELNRLIDNTKNPEETIYEPAEALEDNQEASPPPLSSQVETPSFFPVEAPSSSPVEAPSSSPVEAPPPPPPPPPSPNARKSSDELKKERIESLEKKKSELTQTLNHQQQRLKSIKECLAKDHDDLKKINQTIRILEEELPKQSAPLKEFYRNDQLLKEQEHAKETLIEELSKTEKSIDYLNLLITENKINIRNKNYSLKEAIEILECVELTDFGKRTLDLCRKNVTLYPRGCVQLIGRDNPVEIEDVKDKILPHLREKQTTFRNELEMVEKRIEELVEKQNKTKTLTLDISSYRSNQIKNTLHSYMITLSFHVHIAGIQLKNSNDLIIPKTEEIEKILQNNQQQDKEMLIKEALKKASVTIPDDREEQIKFMEQLKEASASTMNLLKLQIRQKGEVKALQNELSKKLATLRVLSENNTLGDCLSTLLDIKRKTSKIENTLRSLENEQKAYAENISKLKVDIEKTDRSLCRLTNAKAPVDENKPTLTDNRHNMMAELNKVLQKKGPSNEEWLNDIERGLLEAQTESLLRL